jgi:5'-AMP-activated protein kinase catalytic alpha subunit
VERVAREIHILKIVRHPAVVQLYEIVETQAELYLIMEYARGGELFEYIVSRKRLREKDACRFLHQILSGIEYLHKLGICHRDLKPENLLMDDYNNIKIVDFGLSNTYKTGQLLKTACGSPCYAAPEMIAGKEYEGLGADIWSSGVILYAMVCGYLPFEDPKTSVLYKKIMNAEYTIPEDMISDDCKDLIQKFLTTDPKKRCTMGQIKSHPWYTKIKNVRDYSGILIGKQPIPVDLEVLDKNVLKKLGIRDVSFQDARR